MVLSPVEVLKFLIGLYNEIDRTGTNDGNILNGIAKKVINDGSVDTVFKSKNSCWP